jgi:hypothetical protein
MAENKSNNKNRLIELLILGFVIVAMGLLILQVGTDTLNIMDQSTNPTEANVLEGFTPTPYPTPSGATPTDIPITDA